MTFVIGVVHRLSIAWFLHHRGGHASSIDTPTRSDPDPDPHPHQETP